MEAYIRSNTAHDIYKLDQKVPQTVVSGETSNVCQFYRLEWFEWVMFHDETDIFPDDMLKLGHHLGISIDVGLVWLQGFLHRMNTCSTDQHTDEHQTKTG